MIYQTVKPLILASNSPRRKDFLHDLGLDFMICAREIDESVHPGEEAIAYVERVAREKAVAVRQINPDSYIVAADTVVCLEDRILGKPAGLEEAVAMLLSLAGKRHVVRTGVCIACGREGVETVRSVDTSVYFVDFDETVARAYVAQGESLDKAGGYGIQGQGAFLVERVEGSYSNVVGLPLAEVVMLLTGYGAIAPAGCDMNGKEKIGS